MSKEELNDEITKEDSNLSSDSSQTETEDVDTDTTKETICDEEKFASLDEEFKTKMEAKVAQAQAQAQEAEDKYLRTHADFDNIKKRLEKEKYQAIDYASEKFAKDLLATVDTLEMALQSANTKENSNELVGKIKEGIELTLKGLMSTFEKHDITVVETNEFDPQLHNAVMQVESKEHEAGQIVQVMQKGYMYKERLLRPAMVSIAQ